MKYSLDEHDLRMINIALFYFDMHENLDECFGEDGETSFHMNEAFDYLYEISSETPLESPTTPPIP